MTIDGISLDQMSIPDQKLPITIKLGSPGMLDIFSKSLKNTKLLDGTRYGRQIKLVCPTQKHGL